jgi:hypothetical protein
MNVKTWFPCQFDGEAMERLKALIISVFHSLSSCLKSPNYGRCKI